MNSVPVLFILFRWDLHTGVLAGVPPEIVSVSVWNLTHTCVAALSKGAPGFSQSSGVPFSSPLPEGAVGTGSKCTDIRHDTFLCWTQGPCPWCQEPG